MPDAPPANPAPPPPRVSVVMPVYNAQPFLEAAARSILDQTFRDLELIAVDDGSTDDSPAILARLAAEDPRLRVISRPNTGVTGALNDGLAAARALLIARMDADDTALPTRLEKQVAFLDAHPDVGLVGTGWTLCFAGGRRQPPGADLVAAWTAGPGAIAARLTEGHNILGHPTVLFRRAAFDAAGGRYDADFETAEDYECWLRMSRVTRLACLPEPLLDYRVHPQSICATRGHESVDAVSRAVHAHWAATRAPDAATQRAFYRHLAQLHYSARHRCAALREGARALRCDVFSPAQWKWYLTLMARVIKGPAS